MLQSLPYLAVPGRDMQATALAKPAQNMGGSLGDQWPSLERACTGTGRRRSGSGKGFASNIFPAVMLSLLLVPSSSSPATS